MQHSGFFFTINGKVYKCEASFTINSLLKYLGFKADLIALDYNGLILQKEFWSTTILTSNDVIEILTVAGGG